MVVCGKADGALPKPTLDGRRCSVRPGMDAAWRVPHPSELGPKPQGEPGIARLLGASRRESLLARGGGAWPGQRPTLCGRWAAPGRLSSDDDPPLSTLPS